MWAQADVESAHFRAVLLNIFKDFQSQSVYCWRVKKALVVFESERQYNAAQKPALVLRLYLDSLQNKMHSVWTNGLTLSSKNDPTFFQHG